MIVHESSSSESDIPSVPTEQSTKIGCRQSCIIFLAIILVPYILNALFILSFSLINQRKWQINGSPNYTITVQMTAFSPIQGESIVTVQNGEIISGTNGLYDSHGGGAIGLDIFHEVTIERMFEMTYGCALYFPFLICSYEYDSELGYPTRANIDCPIADACVTHLTISDVQINSK